ncbi:hypothetical protein [Schleiferilactobacillus shenzhenensis]|nr:hypothetical protein [Schleiferilactobacillus shenzhenensis]
MKHLKWLLVFVLTAVFMIFAAANLPMQVGASNTDSGSQSTGFVSNENDFTSWTPEQIAAFLNSGKQAQDANTTSSEFQALNKFVKVRNNQYSLEVPTQSGLSSALIAEAQQAISATNRAVSVGHLTIDPTTLVATDNSQFTIRSLAAMETRVIPWAVRVIFRANWAVSTFAATMILIAHYGGEAADYAYGLGNPYALIASIAGNLLANRAAIIGRDAASYNASHQNDKIREDIYITHDDLAVWHD